MLEQWYVCLYILFSKGKVKTLLEWAVGLLSRMLDGVDGWYPFDCYDYQSTCGVTLQPMQQRHFTN